VVNATKSATQWLIDLRVGCRRGVQEPAQGLPATRRNHPWIAERSDELATWIDRFDAVTRRAESTTVPAG
jgi:hypothetical protein